jgi:hypothetical protein
MRYQCSFITYELEVPQHPEHGECSAPVSGQLVPWARRKSQKHGTQFCLGHCPFEKNLSWTVHYLPAAYGVQRVLNLAAKSLPGMFFRELLALRRCKSAVHVNEFAMLCCLLCAGLEAAAGHRCLHYLRGSDTVSGLVDHQCKHGES